MIDTVVQRVIYDRLNHGDLAGKVFDTVPEEDGGSGIFPSITIGDDTITEWDTKGVLGGTVVSRIHTWSRHRGRKEIKHLQGAIYDRLHRADLWAPGWRFVSCEFIQSFSMVDQDGLTRHGVSEFRILIERA